MPPYSYYDTPDGVDYIKKQYYLTRYGSFYGGIMAFHDLLHTQPTGVLPIAHQFLKIWSIPVIGTLIFGSVTYISTHIRKKDDGWNHVLGGLGVTYYLGRYMSYTPTTCILGFGFCVFLYCSKYCKQNFNTVLFPDTYLLHQERYEGLLTRYNTWTWSEDPPRDYITTYKVKEIP
ncbi:hypothetical protein PGB90_008605 [Kerria lacca]